MNFKSVQKKIAAKEGVPMKNAGAILAAGSRKASPEARRENPALNKVSGMPPMPDMGKVQEHKHHNGEKRGAWPHN